MLTWNNCTTLWMTSTQCLIYNTYSGEQMIVHELMDPIVLGQSEPTAIIIA
jgi:hypothetical protein